MSPFVSKKQAKYLFSQKPKIAAEFASKTKSIKALPNKVKPAKKFIPGTLISKMNAQKNKKRSA